MALKGQCNCKSVSVTIADAPPVIGFCHCRTCLRQSGGTGTIFLTVPEQGVRIEGEGVQTYESHGGSGLTVQRMFCGTSGSSIASLAASLPGVTFVKGGVIDDCPTPTFEVWCEDELPWVGAVDNAHRFDRQPPARG